MVSLLLACGLLRVVHSTPVWALRALQEPLVALGEPSKTDSDGLKTALLKFERQRDPEDLNVLEAYMAAHPTSAWRGSLELNLGLMSYQQGRFSRTIPFFASAWRHLQTAAEGDARRQADRAVGELLRMYARIGEVDKLRGLLRNVSERDMSGSSAQLVSQSREALALMLTEPETSFWCGPAALQTIVQRSGQRESEVIKSFPSTSKGTNLADLARLSRRAGRPMMVVFRTPGSQIVLPAVTHWKLGHFAALTKREAGRIELIDPTFGEGLSVTERTLDAEASGYCLIRKGTLPKGYRAVDDLEASKVWGKGVTTASDPDETRDDSTTTGGTCEDTAMAQYDIHAMLCSVKVWDTPISYRPPIGPAIKCRLTYAQRESGQDAVFSHSNLGPNWRFWYLAYVVDNASALTNISKVRLMGGGAETFDPPSGLGAAVNFDRRSRSRMYRTVVSPIRYERYLPDGSKEVYDQDAGGGTARKVFLSKVVDPWGNEVTLQYDSVAKGKLVSITDAGGRVTRLYYDNVDPLLVTRIADPFGRVAAFTYSANKKLIAIRDRIGIVSSFTYKTAASPVIASMTTPYGTTTFDCGDAADPQNAGQFGRYVQATDPLGRPERIEFWHAPSTERYVNYAGELRPNGGVVDYGYSMSHIERRNSFYWDRLNYVYNYPNYDKARIYHWRYQNSKSTGILESLRSPLRSRRFFAFNGQPGAGSANDSMIASAPAEVAFVDDAGVSRNQFSATYNKSGRPTQILEFASATGGAYRYKKLSYDPAPDGIDLTMVQQSSNVAGPYDTVFNATYDHHFPASVTDGSGKTTSYQYTAQGLLKKITNAKGEVTNFEYDAAGRGLLVRVRTQDGKVIASCTYDNALRVSSTTDATGFRIGYTYDNLDRVKSVSYPDGTSEQFTYDKLDLRTYTDRQGRTTEYVRNAVRDLIQVKDANLGLTNLSWCRCGKLKSLQDPNGNLTTWTYDVEGRPIYKHYPDGGEISLSYEPREGRLKQITDAKGQTTRLTYNDDGSLALREVFGAAVQTPNVAFSYDPVYLRPTGISDGRGVTTISYYPNDGSSLGAGRVRWIDGPLANDKVGYTYDEVGRKRMVTIDGVGSTYGYDLLGNVKTEVNPIGTFNYTYQPGTSRLTGVTGGQVKTALAYGTLPADPRLAVLENKRADNAGLGAYGYLYEAQGSIKRWTQSYRQGGTLGDQNFAYDPIDQLRSATVKQGATTLASFSYDYDSAGNRVTSTSDGLRADYSPNILNQIVTEDEQWTNTNTDPTFLRSFSYDANGNTSRISAKNETSLIVENTDFLWNGADQLAAIERRNARTDFQYDGLGRRSHVTESIGGVVQSSKELLWDGLTLIGEISNGQIRRYYSQGMMDFGGSKYYFAKDHLGSIRQVVNSTGAIVGNYQYDPYGKRTVLSEQPGFKCDLGYTGFYLHRGTGLWMSPTRLYRPESGTWISRDPIKESGGLSLNGYVGNTPISHVDLDGLKPTVSVVLKGSEVSGIFSVFYLSASGGLSLNFQSYPWDFTIEGSFAVGVGPGLGGATSFVQCSNEPVHNDLKVDLAMWAFVAPILAGTLESSLTDVGDVNAGFGGGLGAGFAVGPRLKFGLSARESASEFVEGLLDGLLGDDW